MTSYVAGRQAIFQLRSTIKVKLVDKMKQNTYLCVILHVKHKKLPILAVFTRFLILRKIQDGDHVCDVTGIQRRDHP